MSDNRTVNARIAAHASWAATPDRAARTAAARAALLKRFEDEVDPDRVLSEGERAARAEKARKAFYRSNAMKSVEARRARVEAERTSTPKERGQDESSRLRQRVLSLAKQYTTYADGADEGGPIAAAYRNIASDLRTLAAS